MLKHRSTSAAWEDDYCAFQIDVTRRFQRAMLKHCSTYAAREDDYCAFQIDVTRRFREQC
jgi:hypothetical protein